MKTLTMDNGKYPIQTLFATDGKRNGIRLYIMVIPNQNKLYYKIDSKNSSITMTYDKFDQAINTFNN
jgi:hypothetical protein